MTTKPKVFFAVPEINPRTLCFCQPVAFIISWAVAPSGRRSRVTTWDCLEVDFGWLSGEGAEGITTLAALARLVFDAVMILSPVSELNNSTPSLPRARSRPGAGPFMLRTKVKSSRCFQHRTDFCLTKLGCKNSSSSALRGFVQRKLVAIRWHGFSRENLLYRDKHITSPTCFLPRASAFVDFISLCW